MTTWQVIDKNSGIIVFIATETGLAEAWVAVQPSTHRWRYIVRERV
jgi:hypothetical protein